MNSRNEFTVVSTFSGCGGSSLGYQLAGGKVLLAVEWNDNAVETYRLNFPETDIYHGDIGDLTSDEVLCRTGLKTGDLDILDGSPPCQGFSTAGKREFGDDRNQLFREFVRLLRDLQPRVFVMENVSGMVKGKMKLIFAECLRELKDCGYRTTARLMNSMYFGVPQSRKRVIFVGVRYDLDALPGHPSAISKPITFREACDGVPDGTIRPCGEIVLRYSKIHPHGRWSTHPDKWKAIKGNFGSSLTLKWASWDRPVGTLISDERALTGIVHPSRERYLSLGEYKRCATFPDSFEFIDRASGVRRIGNSVPPNFMRAIAEHIRDNILNQVPQPS